jgi:hypothetical protein
MRTGIKILLIFVAFMVTGALSAIIMESTGRTKSAGPLGIILFMAFFAGARAIWKYNPDSNDEHDLDKS